MTAIITAVLVGCWCEAARATSLTLTGGSLAAADAQLSGSVNDQAGKSLTGAGDVNGDGYDDLLVGAPFNDLGPGNDAGAAFLVLGGPDGWGAMVFSFPSVIQYLGALDSDRAGTSVAGAGDVNGDGFDDLVIGAPGDDTAGADAGAAYLVLGSAVPAGTTNLSTQIRLTGETAGDAAGSSVAGGGDVNGDGLSDVLVGAPTQGASDAGAAYLFLGSATPVNGSLGTSVRYSGETTVAGDLAGTSVAMGDTDGDGRADALIGAPGNDDGTGDNAGSAYLVVGTASPASASLGTGTPTVVQFSGAVDSESSGSSVDMGDVNGDGRADFMVGVPGHNPGAAAGTGGVYAVFGRPGMPNNVLNLVGSFHVGEGAGDAAGSSVAFVGDVDADSFGDFVVGAPTQGSVDKGAGYLVRGAASPGGALASHVKYEGALNNDKAGSAVGGSSDLNGDALADVLVGAPENDAVFSNGGAGYVLFAPPPTPASPAYSQRMWFQAGTSGNPLPARFDQARVTVDFTAGALDHGSIDVTRHLFDTCHTDVRAARPIWDIDSTKLNNSSLTLRFKYTSAEVPAGDESNLLVWSRPAGDPCADWTAIPVADTVRDASHNRITATLLNVSSLGSYTLAASMDPPAVEITSGPDGPTNVTTPTFSFTTSTGATTQCRFDVSNFAACSGVDTHTPGSPLSVGFHTFEVRATSSSGSTTASRSFSVDSTLPTVNISSGPAAASTSSDRTPSFGFDANEVGVEFQCQLDAAGFANCTSPQVLSVLADGSHTFQVRGTDLAGNLSSVASRTWTVDATSPTLEITGGPANGSFTNDSTPTHTFTTTEGTLTCRYDAAAFAACSGAGTHTGTALSEGEHTFQVRATDTAGNVTTRERTFTVDTAAPTVTISSGPAAGSTSPDRTPSFGFDSNESGVELQCQVDGTGFANCTSPQILTLADGGHTFQVRGTDVTGNSGPIASRTWTVDATAPVLDITGGPADGSFTNDSPTHTFTANEGTLTCRYDAAAFAACSGAGTHTGTALSEGEHTFSVRATDAAGNATTRDRTFTVDTAAPTVTLSGPPATASSDQATFNFAANEPATFECKLDGASFAPCTSPLIATGLADGAHSFQVRATDRAANQATATHNWTVALAGPPGSGDTQAPNLEITSGPLNGAQTSDNTPTYGFETNEGTLTCRFDADAFAVCSGPGLTHTPAPLPDGPHTFSVRAVDGSGNTSTRSRDVIVDTSPPAAAFAAAPAEGSASPDRDPVIAFKSSEEESSFQCSLDGGAFAACISPFVTAQLSDGFHSVSIRATDLAGNQGASVTRSFTVDATGPIVQITAGPPFGAATHDPTPTFAFTSEPGASFQCRFSGGTFAPCSGEGTHTPAAALADGPKAFFVRAIDGAGNRGDPLDTLFTLDTVPPTPRISGPSKVVTKAKRVRVAFTLSSSEPSTFTCKVDKGRAAACQASFKTKRLKRGKHTLAVTATDQAGNAAPKVKRFRIIARPRT